AELVERLATRYGDHPALAMWHVGNEFGCHVPASYDDESAAAFRDWLRERYTDIGTLNEAWSTAFWSQRYTCFEEILPPRLAPSYPNPAQQLDFARFSDDAMLACYRAEAEILRRITPGVRITTNFLSLRKPVDVYKWAPFLDVVSVDNYPDPADPRAYLWSGLTYDIMRSAKGGQPWMLMEHATSAVNWRPVNPPQRPGQLRVTSLQAVAHGADAVMFFQWRASRGGAEKFHSGMVPHAGPDGRVFGEVKALGAALAEVPDLAGTRVASQVALLLDWESWWASELDSRPSALTSQADALMSCYAPLFSRGMAVDVVHPDADLSGYRVVVACGLHLLRAATAERLASWTRAGGRLVVTFGTGIVDERDQVHLGGYPGPLAPVVGAVVEEHVPLPAGESVALESGATGTIWSERVLPRGAEVLDRFASGDMCTAASGDSGGTGASGVSGDLAGEPAVTRHGFGAGAAWYVATRLDEESMGAVLDEALEAAGAEPVLPGLPPGVQAARRGDYLILLNHGGEPREVALPGEMVLPDGTAVTRAALAGYGTAILRQG
ncbi:MAG: beta-galactosidase, partial [Nocardiopsaceae bacterium]|nr:beta-galactosidase [Nocardiopsaceae bacterium]